MASRDIENELLAVAQGAFPESVERLRGQMELLSTVTVQQNSQVRENTEALVQNTVSRGSTASAAANTAKNITNSLGIGLFLSPLISGIAKLFGGGQKEEPPPLVPFSRPAPMALEAAVGPGGTPGLTGVDYDQQGQPRRTTPSVSQNVTIQVQALDSRSILDRSDDIARAVRQAMLNSHSVNDVIGEI